MAISLEFRDNIQFIVLEGNFSKVEEAALRLKLDQKFSQGRTLFVLKLDRFDFESSESILSLQHLANYFYSLGAWIALSGLNNKQQGVFQSLYKTRCKSFSTEPEAKKWILEESQKPKEAPKKQTEEDIKKVEIENLIQSYSKSFIEKDDDPFRIVKLGTEYQATPSADFIHALRTLLAEKEKLAKEIQQKEIEIDQSEQVILDFMSFRKLPSTEGEIQSHMKMAESKASDTEKTLSDLNSQIKAKTERLAAIKDQMQKHHEAWKKKIQDHEEGLRALKSDHERVIQEFKRREKEETERLEKLRQGAS